MEAIQRPTLVLAHNKTLAAQLYSEFKEFFQQRGRILRHLLRLLPARSYVARTDTYIEKDSDDQRGDRQAAPCRDAIAAHARRDVVIVASVSCIYGLGSPEEYRQVVVSLRRGRSVRREKVLRHLVDIQYDRNDMDLARGKFRVRGDTLEVYPAYEEIAVPD